MPHTTSLIILGALCAGGIVAGVDLGRSTIDGINPAYTKDPDSPFYADLAPGSQTSEGQPQDWQQVAAQELQAAQGPPAPATCLDCTWPVDPTPRHDPAVDRALEAWTPPSEPARIRAARARADPELAQVARYAEYAPQPEEDHPPAPAPRRAADEDNQDPDGL